MLSLGGAKTLIQSSMTSKQNAHRERKIVPQGVQPLSFCTCSKQSQEK